MKNLKVWQKLLLLGAVFLLPLAVVSYTMISSVNSLGIEMAEKELLGVEYSLPLLDLLRDLQQHRGLRAAIASGGSAVQGTFTMKTNEAQRDLDAVTKVEATAAIRAREQTRAATSPSSA